MADMKFCAEIQYETAAGWVHSDACHACGESTGEDMTASKREFYHDLLDEWLDRSRGSGAFWIGDAKFMVDNFADAGK